jgi:hypothetical protein
MTNFIYKPLPYFLVVLLAFATHAHAEPSVERGQRILMEWEGETRYGEVVGMQQVNEQTRYAIQLRRYINSSNLTSRVVRAQREQITLPAQSHNVRLQGQDRELRRGLVVLGRNNQLWQIDDVFADGRVVVTPLHVNRNSRNRVSENFARLEHQNVSIINAQDIAAVEVDSYGGYEKNGVYTHISGMPLCDARALESYQLPRELRDQQNLRFSCGRGGQAHINGLFSNGSVSIGAHIFNPFPRSIEQYLSPESDTPSSAQ